METGEVNDHPISKPSSGIFSWLDSLVSPHEELESVKRLDYEDSRTDKSKSFETDSEFLFENDIKRDSGFYE